MTYFNNKNNYGIAMSGDHTPSLKDEVKDEKVIDNFFRNGNIYSYKKSDVLTVFNIYCTYIYGDAKVIEKSFILLMDMFKTPSNIYYDKIWIKDFYILALEKFSFLKISNKYNEKHIALCEQLSEFFMFYSRFICKNIELFNDTLSERTDITDNLKASMDGLAIGDAIGFLVEGQPRKVCEEYLQKVVKTREFHKYGVDKQFGQKGKDRYNECKSSWAFKFGQYTDDTQLCRELIKTILNNKGKFSSDDYANSLIWLLGSSNLLRNDTIVPENKHSIKSGIVGYGTTTRNSVQALADGCSWEQSGTIIKGNGNGSVMRVAPLGPLFFHKPYILKELVNYQSIGTHGNSKCRGCAVMIAEASRLACESSIYPWSKHIVENPVLFCKRLSSQVKSIDSQLSKVITLIPTWMKEKDEMKIVKTITKKGKELGDSLWHHGNVISASCVQTSLFCILCFLKNYDSYEDAISMCIRAGGDTDTTAAICGSITAARTGKTIENMNKYINDRGNWGLNEMRELIVHTKYCVDYNN